MTKVIVTYLCSDGLPHSFDGAQRKTPLCGADVWVVSLLADAPKNMAPACEGCAMVVLDLVQGLP